MKKELDSLLQTAEKAFAVELLTMPAAVRRMKRKEVLGELRVPGTAGGIWELRGKVCFVCPVF